MILHHMIHHVMIVTCLFIVQERKEKEKDKSNKLN